MKTTVGREIPDLFLLCRMLILIPFVSHPLVTSAQEIPDITVTIKAGGTVQEVLDDISRQTNYYFTYNASLFPARNPVNFHGNNLPLETALDSLLNDSSLQYRLIDKNIVIFRKNRLTVPYVKENNDSVLMVKGRVTDGRTRKPLPFATVTLYGSTIGTISNESGAFLLKVPIEDVKNEAVLAVSFIGYRNQYVHLSLSLKNEMNISLQKDLVSLQEVIIRYKDPATLLEEAVRRIPENYSTSRNLLTAYYRENVQRNHKTLVFSEAVMDISKEPYDGFSGIGNVSIIKGRKFVDVDDEDTVLMKIKSGIRSSLELDIAGRLPYFLDTGNRDLYDFEFSDIVSYKNKLAYKIGFRQKPHLKEALYNGYIYIDMENLAILAADFQLEPHFIGGESNTFVIRKSPGLKIRPLSAVYHVDYRPDEGTYYLSQVRGEVRFRMRKRKKWFTSVYSLRIELAVTDLRKEEVPRFRSHGSFNTGAIFSDLEFTYDPAFWGDYNTIEPEASLNEVLRKMGKPRSW